MTEMASDAERICHAVLRPRRLITVVERFPVRLEGSDFDFRKKVLAGITWRSKASILGSRTAAQERPCWVDRRLSAFAVRPFESSLSAFGQTTSCRTAVTRKIEHSARRPCRPLSRISRILRSGRRGSTACWSQSRPSLPDSSPWPNPQKWTLLSKALPAILSGLKIGWAFAWRTLIAAELVFGAASGKGGLGWYIYQNRNELYTDRVFAGLLVVILIGLFVKNVVFATLERVTVRRWGVVR